MWACSRELAFETAHFGNLRCHDACGCGLGREQIAEVQSLDAAASMDDIYLIVR